MGIKQEASTHKMKQRTGAGHTPRRSAICFSQAYQIISGRRGLNGSSELGSEVDIFREPCHSEKPSEAEIVHVAALECRMVVKP